MLPDGGVVWQVALGNGGVGGMLGRLARDAIVLDMSSSDPPMTMDLGAELTSHGIRLVDAPVMGGVPFARDGSLDILAGGKLPAIQHCMPVFDALGRQVFICGSLYAGHAIKALLNAINAAILTVLAEALATGTKWGIPLAVLVDAVEAMCMGRSHPQGRRTRHSSPDIMRKSRRFCCGGTHEGHNRLHYSE
jgi:3-hydroxyisobutyrate dehydrogenase